MNAKDLKNSILQLAIQGKLLEQREEEGTAKELLKKIEDEKKQLIKEGKIKKQKDLPSISEDEIPFEIPESWQWVRVLDLSLFIKAGGDKPKDFLKRKTETHKVPVIANGIQNDGIIGYTKEATVEESCITVSGRGTIGFSYLRTEPFTPVVRLLALKISDLVDNRYVQNVLTALLERGVGTSIKQLTIPMIETKIIPLPPLEEQKRIVAKIEELKPFVDKYDIVQSELEELNKKFPEDMQKSILQYAIQGKLVEQREEDGTAEDLYNQIQEEKKKLIKEGKLKKTKDLPEISEDEIPFDIPESWKWVRFGSVIILTSGQDMTPNSYNDIELGVPYLTGASNIQDEKIIINRWTDKPKSLAVKGDILISCKGTIGKTVILEEETVHIARQIMSVRPIRINIRYVKYFLMSYVSILKSKAKSMIPGIERNDVLGAYFPLPPLEEQKRIVERIEFLLPYINMMENSIVK